MAWRRHATASFDEYIKIYNWIYLYNIDRYISFIYKAEPWDWIFDHAHDVFTYSLSEYLQIVVLIGYFLFKA